MAVISISRQAGSGGHEIAELVSKNWAIGSLTRS